MNKIIHLFWLLSFTIPVLFAQTTSPDATLNSGNLILVKKNNVGIANRRVVSPGDKIAVQLNDNRTFRGAVAEISSNNISLNGQEKIDFETIRWIKKSKPRTSDAIIGLAMAVGGAVLFAHVSSGDVDFDSILPLGAASVGLITAGILIAYPPKFKLYKRDQLIYTE
jgi:hypothetical protein